nr:nuclear pore complex protein nup85 [Hymenolepis microstoma]
MCHQELCEYLENCKNLSGEKRISLIADADLVKTCDLLWHLAEVVLLQALSPGKLTNALCEWYFVQSQEASMVSHSFLDKHSSCGGPLKFSNESELLFWTTVLALLIQGQPVEVSALLMSHSKANTPLFRDVRQLLAAIPQDESNSVDRLWQRNASAEKAWQHWQGACALRLVEETRNRDLSGDLSSEYLTLILSILAGRQDCWSDARVTEACGTWYFQFVGWLFYTNHFVDAPSLSTMLEQFTAKFNVDLNKHLDSHLFASVIDQVIQHIFAKDIVSVVFVLSEKFNNWWMVAHFSNFVKHLLPDFFAGMDSTLAESTRRSDLKMEGPDNGIDGRRSRPIRLASLMPDFFLMRYAESLAADPSLLSIAMGYLDYCTTLRPTAHAVQASLLQRAKPTTTRLTNEVIQLARKHKLPEVVDEISLTKCRSSLPHFEAPVDAARACTALGWAIIARDVQLIAHIITRTMSRSMSAASHDDEAWSVVKEVARIVTCLFEDRASTSQKTSQSWLVPLISSPEFAFISRYAELQSLLQAGNDEEGIIYTTLDLLSTGDISGGFNVPPKFKFHLLKQLQPHLNPAALKGEYVRALGAVVAELKAAISLSRIMDEEVQDLLMALSALIVQAKALNTMNACDQSEYTYQPMAGDYAFSEGGLM